MNQATVLNSVRIFLIEPQPLLAEGLRSVVDGYAGMEIVATAGVFKAQDVLASRPDLIVVDCSEPSLLDEMLRQCRSMLPAARICVLSEYGNPEAMLHAFSSGADGYVIKDSFPSQLREALLCVARNGFYADPRISNELIRVRTKRGVMALSARELEVVRLIAAGLSNKEIAERLTLSDKTVKNHVSNIFEKLHLNARTQIVAYAIRAGIG